MWPNKNNFASFGIKRKNTIKKNFYIYENYLNKNLSNKKRNISIDELTKLKKFINSDKSFFFKNLNYFKNRYLSYRKKDYLINKFVLNKSNSFFILKRNKNKSVSNYVILDHFGSKK